MKFQKYSSIENSYRVQTVELIRMYGFDQGHWVLLEKVHGSNFSIWFDGKTMKCAKRSGWLSPTESFYNFQTVLDEVEEKVKTIFSTLHDKTWRISNTKGIKQSPKSITVFGELCGGFYDHPDVPRNPKAIKVQKEVQYHPENKMMAFDVKVDDEFVSVDDANTLLEFTFFDMLPVLFRGSFDECLEFPPVFNSHVAHDFGLPAIEGNVGEGYVIKPVRPLRFDSGERVILKNKNDKFKEKVQKNKGTGVKKIPSLSPEAYEAIENIKMFINENRLRNVLSKIGPIQKDFKKIMSEFSTDIMTDFMKEFGTEFTPIEKKERKIIMKLLGHDASNLIRGNFANILDGNF